MVLVFGVARDTLSLNPVQRVALPYRYSISEWEVRNFPDKWVHLLRTRLFGREKSEAERLAELERYFELGQDLLGADYALDRAMSGPSSGEVQALQEEVERLAGERSALRDSVEETIESALSTAIREAGLSGWESFVFPPVDIRLAGPPIVLLTSPRDRIERQHEVLMEPDISLVVRESLEDRLMEEEDVAAISIQVGGLAAYPASVLDTLSPEYTFRAGAHEWMHHYMAFRPLGQKMFTSGEMVTLNETLADIVGREIGDAARELVFTEEENPSTQESPLPAPESGLHGRDEHFGYREEMRETRLRVDELLAEGKVEEAEAYMEERRLKFVENGYPIRRLNQAYFAFHGTYAENAASSSPIAGQLHRFRELMPDLRTFVSEMGGISSYAQFLERLAELEGELEYRDSWQRRVGRRGKMWIPVS